MYGLTKHDRFGCDIERKERRRTMRRTPGPGDYVHTEDGSFIKQSDGSLLPVGEKPVSDFRISGPKDFRTKDDEKATVVYKHGPAWYGHIDGHRPCAWLENGKPLMNGNPGNELVAEWSDPPPGPTAYSRP